MNFSINYTIDTSTIDIFTSPTYAPPFFIGAVIVIAFIIGIIAGAMTQESINNETKHN